MIGGVYHPRATGGAMSDALADARRALARLTAHRWPCAARACCCSLAAPAALVALASYSLRRCQPQQCQSARRLQLLGPLGAIGRRSAAADLRLCRPRLPRAACGVGPRALIGKGLSHAMWRAVAWPLGTVLVAAGLGLFPRPQALPAGAGGWIGIAASSLSTHAAQVYGQPWIGMALPLLLLPPACRWPSWPPACASRAWRAMSAPEPRAVYWLGGLVKLPSRPTRSIVRSYDEDDEEPDTQHVEEHEDDYRLDIAPEPIAATRLAERRESRVKREEARRAPKPAKARQAAGAQSRLRRISAAGAGPSDRTAARCRTRTRLSDEALEENARMLEAVLTDFGVKGRITAVRPGPVVTLV